MNKNELLVGNNLTGDILDIQALIGVAFSLGFIFGPMIGAAFSVLGKANNGSSFTMFQYPALFSLTMATIDIILVVLLFKETLPQERRVSQYHFFESLSTANVLSLSLSFTYTGQITWPWNQWNSLFDQPRIAV